MTNTLNRSEIIKWIICLALALACFLIPESAVITMKVKIFLFITVLGLSFAAFELTPNLLIAIMMPALWAFFGVAPIGTILSFWTSIMPLMVVGVLFMVASMEDCGLLRRVGLKMMCLAKGNYMILLMIFFITTVVLTIFTNGTGYLIAASLGVGLCVTLNGMQKNVGAGVAAAVMIGGCTSHIYTYQAAGWAILMPAAGNYVDPSAVTPLTIIIHNFPMFLISALLVWVGGKMFKPEESLGEIVYFQEQLHEMGEMSRKERVNLVMLILVLLYVFTVSFHGLDVNYGYALIPWIVYFPFVNGADSETIKKVNFEIVFFMGACMGIGTVANTLGLGAPIVQMIDSLLNGNNSAFALTGIVFGIVFILNFVMTPLAIWALITDPILSMAVSMGLNPLGVTYAINACSEAILFPYEYVPYLLVYAFGMMRMGDFIKYNIIRSVVILLSMVFIMVPYWSLLGII